MRARRSLILDTTVRLVFDTALVLSLYLLFAGHNRPGGGFVGGLVAAAALSLRYLAGGAEELRAVAAVRPWTLLASGLALAVATALVPLVFADTPLDHSAVEWDLPLLGHLKATGATVFDTGVYLIVVGLVLMIFEGLADEPDEEREVPADRSVR
jgi:multisubunit Na+/H+ antiporter MnhB subunit